MPVKDLKAWNREKPKGKNAYLRAIWVIADRVMVLIDKLPAAEKLSAENLIRRACKDTGNVGRLGITGFMATMISHLVSVHHSRGLDFRASWNLNYGVKDATKGTVNPCVLTVG